MIDVLIDIVPLLVFENEDDFYYLQIIKRKKENEDLGSNSKVIKNYYISSLEHLLKNYQEIKDLCHVTNSRAMLRLNKRSFEKVALKTIINVANSISCKDYKYIKNSYDRACGVNHNDPNKKWIIDIDGKIDENFLYNIKQNINHADPIGEKVILQLPTKNGIHLITRPFNLLLFKQLYPQLEVHKDNPINLYIP